MVWLEGIDYKLKWQIFWGWDDFRFIAALSYFLKKCYPLGIVARCFTIYKTISPLFPSSLVMQ